MARIARVVVPGTPHHVVQRGVRSMDIFASDDDRLAYLELLGSFGRRSGVSFWAWCLMSNQVHLVAVPARRASLRRAIGEAHRRYTRLINFREDVRGHLFQERFHSYPIQNDRHLLAVVRYVELNPVRAGLVRRAAQYPWSSARHHVRRRRDPLVTHSPIRRKVRSWGRFLRAEEDEESREVIERHIRTGRPLGTAAWIAGLERRLRRRLAPRPPGRPPRRR